LQWKRGKVISTKLYAKSDQGFRLIPPQEQAVFSIRSSEGKLVMAGQNGIIRPKSGAAYMITFH